MTSTRNGNALWVANRQSTSLKRFARHEFIYRGDTEFELVSGVLREIVRGQLLDAARSGLSENETARLKGRLEELEGEQVLQTTGISDDRIRSLAQAMREAETLLILCGKDVADHRNSLKILSVLYELLELTGHENRKESGLNLLWEGCNSQGAQDCGVFLNRLPGYQDILDKDSRTRVEEVWGVPVPRMPGLDVEYMLKSASEGKLKAIYLVGSDPLSEYPDRNSAREALKKLDFIVAQDIFLTETAKLAHVVLPGASFAEKNGTFTSVERRVQRIRKAFDPSGNSRADWHIICSLAQAMGYDFDYASPAEIFRELTTVSPIHEEMSWEDLGETGKRW
jgi:predicted molibdopterin-dependent oxidoreductase YjgC